MSSRHHDQYTEAMSSFKSNFKNPILSTRVFLKKMFPIVSWLPKYQLPWLYNDLVAGVTCGLISSLPLQYGLTTSFFAISLYPIFGTSKDVSVGATGVLSTVIGQLIASQQHDLAAADPIVWASAVALVSGVLQLLFGLLGLGIIVDFIPNPVIQGFMTGGALAVMIGQLPSLFGITGIDSNDMPVMVLFNTLKKIETTKLDLAFGLGCIVFLIVTKMISVAWSKRSEHAKWLGIARNVLAVVLFTLLSYLIHIGRSSPLIRIVTSIPSGLSPPKMPEFPNFTSILQSSITVVLVGTIEHMAIVKSFGRCNGYNPVPSQELVAVGIGNIYGSFFGVWPATGSFSRSAISSQSGSKSPLTAFFTSLVVLAAIFFLMPLLYYMPNSVLSGIVIVALSDLLIKPAAFWQLVNVDVLDLIAFLLVSICSLIFTIERSIYIAVGFALVIVLVRLARPHWDILVKDEETGKWVAESETYPSSMIHGTPPGMLAIRLEEGLIYPNSSYLNECIKQYVQENTGKAPLNQQRGSKEKIWSDLITKGENENLPRLRSLLIDFSQVNFIDITGLQMLTDLKRDLEAFSGQEVSIHFCGVKKRLRRKLVYFANFMVEKDHAKTDLVSLEEAYTVVVDAECAYLHDSIQEGLNWIERYELLDEKKMEYHVSFGDLKEPERMKL